MNFEQIPYLIEIQIQTKEKQPLTVVLDNLIELLEHLIIPFFRIQIKNQRKMIQWAKMIQNLSKSTNPCPI